MGSNETTDTSLQKQLPVLRDSKQHPDRQQPMTGSKMLPTMNTMLRSARRRPVGNCFLATNQGTDGNLRRRCFKKQWLGRT